MRKDVELIGAVENAITEINTEIHRTPSRVSVSAAEHLRNATHKVVAAFQRADLEAAETERRLRVQMLEISEHAGAHLCRAEAAEAQVEAMRKALEPFAATIPDKPTEDARFYGWNPSVITYGDCKQARAALASSTPESSDHVADPGKKVGWHTTPHDDLPAAIAEFKAALPGWWYSVCECQVSCDASCAPTVESLDIERIPPGPQDPMNPDPFDAGFHANLGQPSTLAEALRDVMRQALALKAVAAPAAPAEARAVYPATLDAVEVRAEQIYNGWGDLPGWVPWVVGGNSTKQDEARREARSEQAEGEA